MSQARFQKQQREKARRERAAAKWAKRAERDSIKAPEPEAPVHEQATVLARRDSAGVTHLLPWWPISGRRVRGSLAPDVDRAGGKPPVQNERSTLD